MGRKPDRSYLLDVFGDLEPLEIVTTGTRPKPLVASTAPGNRIAKKSTKPANPTSTKTEKNGKQSQSADARFQRKLEQEYYHEFDHVDWLQYFKHVAFANDIRYIIGNYAKEYSIIKALMKELHWDAIKAMIDFIFYSDQDIIDKRTAGIIHLSSGWLNTMYQNSQLWLSGEYAPRSRKKEAPKRTREWTGAEPSVASLKSSGTGINYGKPIREEQPLPTKPKSGVRF